MTTSPMLHNCFVGMFDIIGFQALRKNIGTTGLHQRFIRGILPAIEHSAAGGGKSVLKEGVSLYVPVISKSSVECRIISDSVIFIVRDDSFESFMNIVHSSFMLVQFGFSGLKAPYRGAIGWGDLIIDNNIVVGSAIEDAHRPASPCWSIEDCQINAMHSSWRPTQFNKHRK